MPKFIQIFAGPELFWVVLYSLTFWMAKINQPPAFPMNKLLENFFWLIPLLALISFFLYLLPVGTKNWLFLRLWIAGLVGGHLVLEKGLAAHSEQSPGIGMAYLLGVMLVFFALLGGTIFLKIRETF